ncbi:hypothetical protein DV515_00001283, partial [Chloebia gouldiae]
MPFPAGPGLGSPQIGFFPATTDRNPIKAFIPIHALKDDTGVKEISLQTSKGKYQAKKGREGEGKVRRGERERERGKMASEFRKKLFWRAVVAEFLAMSLFIFISIGSALGFNFPMVANKTSTKSQDNVKVSLAFGLSIATMAQSVGHISGAHLNPAVTLGLLLSCQISIFKALMYILAQCLGAVVATAILSGVTSSLPGNTLGLNA